MSNTQKNICFYFQVHQPYRLSEVSYFAEENENFFEGPVSAKNIEIFEKVAKKCYLPSCNLLYFLLKKHPEFRISFSFSGTFLQQCEEFGAMGQSVLKAFQKLVKTGQVEVLGETFYHSLSFLFSWEEYATQIAMHSKKVKEIFGVTPKIFRNTELIYRNDIGEFVRQLGFQGMLCEGWEDFLNGKNQNSIFLAEHTKIPESAKKIAQKYSIKKQGKNLPLLLKNYRLSDDIAFRFSEYVAQQNPLLPEQFVNDILENEGENFNLFMDFETFGEHQWRETGIFSFLQNLPKVAYKKNVGFCTPSQAVKNFQRRKKEVYNVDRYLSWADSERDISAWMDNSIQQSALCELKKIDALLSPHRYEMNQKIQELLGDFRKLQTSDHLYYMCTKYFSDGDVHAYFSPYNSEYSPYEAYIHFMNTARNLEKKIEKQLVKKV